MIECFGDIINDKVITIGCLNLTQIDSFSARYVLSKATKSCCNHASSETWIHWIWNYTIVSFTSFVLQRCNPRIFGSIRHRMRARRIQSDSAHVTSRSCLRIPTMHAIWITSLCWRGQVIGFNLQASIIQLDSTRSSSTLQTLPIYPSTMTSDHRATVPEQLFHLQLFTTVLQNMQIVLWYKIQFSLHLVPQQQTNPWVLSWYSFDIWIKKPELFLRYAAITRTVLKTFIFTGLVNYSKANVIHMEGDSSLVGVGAGANRRTILWVEALG